jgi:hypothetical protein
MKLMIGSLPKYFLAHTSSLEPHKTTQISQFSLLVVGVCVCEA